MSDASKSEIPRNSVDTRSDKGDTWNHKTPVIFSPLFDWPLKPKAVISVLTKRWITLSRNALFLVMAFLVYRYLLPEQAVSRSLSLSWVLPVFLRNYLIMLLIAGGLHLYFFTYRGQGKRLKYLASEDFEKSGKFSFWII